MNDETEVLARKQSWPDRHYPVISLSGLTKIMKSVVRIAGVLTNIQTEQHLPNMSLHHYLQTNFFSTNNTLLFPVITHI
jgi:hypothetical protein